MSHNPESGTIASHVFTTLESFRNLESSLNELSDSSSLLDPKGPNKIELTLENDFTRFKMWAGNQAAHQSGPASLDHRLREAPHLQQQVLYLLKDLSESLEDADSLVSQGASDLHQIQSDGDSRDDKASLGSVDHDDRDDFSDSDYDDGPQTDAGLSTLLEDIGEAIDCLLRLSVAIANPAPHERFRKLGAGPSEDISFYEPHDIAYVRDKFPKLSDGLAETLGKFITRRRQFFKYREAHHAKMAAGLDSRASNKEADTSRTEVIPKTVASSLPEHLRNIVDFDPRTDFIDEDGRSDTGMTQTSYATSAGFLAEDTDEHVQRPPPPLRVPPLPASAENGIFECPFCYRMISARTRTAWKRHVFGDLRPYTCIISHCAKSNTDFDRRHVWQSHVSKYHWRSWSCPFKCNETTFSALELTQHVKIQHLPGATEKEVEAIVARGEREASSDTSNQCVVCGHTVTGLKKYIKHVGRHLEQLALFALPSLEDDNAQDEYRSDEDNNVASELDGNSSQVSSRAPSPVLHPLAEGILSPDEEEDAIIPVAGANGKDIDEQEFSEKRAGKQPATLASSADDLVATKTEVNKQQTEEEVAPLRGSDGSNDSGGPRHCPCNRAPFGSMVTCYNSDCKHEWFHFECVGLDKAPRPGWHCPECRIKLNIGEGSEGIFNDATYKYVDDTVAEAADPPGSTLTTPQTASETSSGSYDDSEYKRSSTTGLTRSSSSDTDNVTIKVPRSAVVRVAGTEIRFDDGAEITIPSRPGGSRVGSDRASSISTQDTVDDVVRIERDSTTVEGGKKPKKLEEETRAKAEGEIFAKIEEEKKKAAEATAAEEAAKKAAEELKKRIEEDAKAQYEEAKKRPEQAPIRFKDAVGRKFSFPFHLVRTWAGMEDLIKQAFNQIDVVGPHVMEGHYDLFGPDGELIFPSVWERVIEPGWAITMTMWPMNKTEAKASGEARPKYEIEAEARVRAEREARKRYEAEMKAAAEQRQVEAQAKAKAEEEARLKFEAESKIAEERGKKKAEERVKAEREARIEFEAELRAAEERRQKEEEDLARAEELARVRFERALQEEKEAKEAAAEKAQEEAERLMRAEQEAKEERARKHALAMAEASEKARVKFEAEMKADPEMVRLEAEINFLKEEKAKAAEKQKEAEAQSRKEAEEAFHRRMEDMRLAQEEAKREIEKARLEAEKAARERIEAERKAEEERARKHALAMAEADEKTRPRIEAETKATEDRKEAEAES